MSRTARALESMLTKFKGWKANKICHYLISFLCSFKWRSVKYEDRGQSTEHSYEFAASTEHYYEFAASTEHYYEFAASTEHYYEFAASTDITEFAASTEHYYEFAVSWA